MDFDITANFGNLHRVSPEEPVHAFTHAVAAAIERNAPQTELDAWLACALNTPMEFLIVPNEQAMAWRAVNIREKTGTSCEALFRSAIQRVYDVWKLGFLGYAF